MQFYFTIPRYLNAPTGDPLPLMSRAAIHARIATMPLNALPEGVHALITSPPRHTKPVRLATMAEEEIERRLH